MGNVCTYMCHMSSQWYQKFDKENSTYIWYTAEQIWLPHCKYSSHSQHAIWTWHFCIHMPKYYNCNIYFTCYFQICVRNKYAHQTGHIGHVCQFLQAYIWEMPVYICAKCEGSVINHVTSNTIQRCHCQWWCHQGHLFPIVQAWVACWPNEVKSIPKVPKFSCPQNSLSFQYFWHFSRHNIYIFSIASTYCWVDVLQKYLQLLATTPTSNPPLTTIQEALHYLWH